MKNILFSVVAILSLANLVYSQANGEWKTVYTFSGNSSENTDDFTIKSNKFCIIWVASKQYEEVYGGNFIVHLVDSDGKEDLIINVIPEDSGKTIIRKKGTFYFKVTSALTKWNIEVQQYRSKK